MAGNYPDAPGHRMAYDRDGSLTLRTNVSTAAITTLTAAQARALNDESNATLYSLDGTSSRNNFTLTIMFPELRDIVGYSARMAGSFCNPAALDTSVNPWVQGTTVEAMRSPSVVSFLGVKAIRFRGTTDGGSGSYQLSHVHLYGSPSAGQAPDRLRFWNPTLNQEVAGHHADYGNVARNSVLPKTFRIKNPSATLTAYSVGLTSEALTDTVPTNVGQMEFSVNGGAYASSVNLGDLAPGAISPIITWRRTTPAGAVLGVWWFRAVASAASYAP
jgi:hypothetical protein